MEITWKNQSRFAPAEDKTFGDVDRQYKLIGQDNDAVVEYRSKPLPIRGEPIQSDLSAYRRGPEKPPREREIELILAAQAGDETAKNELSRHFMSWLRKLARERWRALAQFHRMEFNQADQQVMQDLVAIALAEWWQQVLAWQPGFGGLYAYAKLAVEGALSDATHDFRNVTAIKNESDFARFVRSNPGANAWQIHKFFPSMTLNEIERERAYVWDSMLPIEYVEDGNGTNDDNGDHDADGDFKGGNETQFAGPVRGYEGGLVSEWSRGQAANSLHPARSLEHPSNWVTGKKRGSVLADRLLAARDRRVIAEINQIGRRAYADLVFNRASTAADEPPTLHFEALSANHREVRHSEPLPGPGQVEAQFSCYNLVSLSKHMSSARSLNLAPRADIDQPISFDDTISSAIAATDVTAHNDNDFKKAA